MKTDLHTILIRPRITEKATIKSENSVYTFEIAKSANKKEVAKAVKEIYKVTPVKVATVNIPQKRVIVRGKRGSKASYKKAYVYLAKGQKLEIN
jgi:large subunit ribosomal protein L23